MKNLKLKFGIYRYLRANGFTRSESTSYVFAQ